MQAPLNKILKTRKQIQQNLFTRQNAKLEIRLPRLTKLHTFVTMLNEPDCDCGSVRIKEGSLDRPYPRNQGIRMQTNCVWRCRQALLSERLIWSTGFQARGQTYSTS